MPLGKFARLTVVRKTKIKTKDRRFLYEMKCDCGKKVLLPMKVVKNGNTKSCGCLRREVSAKLVAKVRHLAAIGASIKNRKHGMKGTRFYTIWRGMLGRCNNPKSPSYKYYGKRGISVCNNWNDFSGFYNDMYKSYKKHCSFFGENRKGTTLDRLDNDGNYCKENCRWATIKTQRDNQRNPYELNPLK